MKIIIVLLLSSFYSAPSLAANDPEPPAIMLATVYEAGAPVSEYWISEKLDGVRGFWDGESLWTRGGHLVNPPEWFTAGWPSVAMDGELWIARGRFAEASGIVRTHIPVDADWRRLQFRIFDLPAHPGAFEARVMGMRSLLAEANIAWLRPITQFRVADIEELDARLDAVIAAGGEGLMLHHREALYKAGRSDGLLKYKPYSDAEARVVGHTAGKGKYRGMLGALIVEQDGMRFRLGSGLSDAQRADPPPIGSWVTYRFNGLTANGLPRFARFLRVRHELPPPED